jgi:hypothetical protein
MILLYKSPFLIKVHLVLVERALLKAKVGERNQLPLREGLSSITHRLTIRVCLKNSLNGKGLEKLGLIVPTQFDRKTKTTRFKLRENQNAGLPTNHQWLTEG